MITSFPSPFFTFSMQKRHHLKCINSTPENRLLWKILKKKIESRESVSFQLLGRQLSSGSSPRYYDMFPVPLCITRIKNIHTHERTLFGPFCNFVANFRSMKWKTQSSVDNHNAHALTLYIVLLLRNINPIYIYVKTKRLDKQAYYFCQKSKGSTCGAINY